ncbi:MAG: hypothetical protein AAGF23_04370 [Acidobacteriota bacterium]
MKPATVLLAAAALAVAALSVSLAHIDAERRAFDAERRDAAEARREAERVIDDAFHHLQEGLGRSDPPGAIKPSVERFLSYYDRRHEGREGCVGWLGCDDRQIVGLARTVTRSGHILRKLGDLDGALDAYGRNRYRFRGLLEFEQRRSWQLELARAHRLMAEIHLARGETDHAFANARSAVGLSAALAPSAPTPEPEPTGLLPADWAEVHLDNLHRFAEVRRALGDIDGSGLTLLEARAVAAENGLEPDPPRAPLEVGSPSRGSDD